ncbi:MAG: hypothetical protein E5V51_14875 [Mesorhizobium sp.]|nr:MAG: hypothetical protein E5V51_14875 [Mesorhizobium sp.]
MIAAAPLGDVAFTVGAASHRFVILGRSKEGSDAAQTLGSMPGRQRASHRLRHPRAEQGAQRRGADPRIHAVGLKRCDGAEFRSAPLRGHGMDPRVSATELRSCFALG